MTSTGFAGSSVLAGELTRVVRPLPTARRFDTTVSAVSGSRVTVVSGAGSAAGATAGCTAVTGVDAGSGGTYGV